MKSMTYTWQEACFLDVEFLRGFLLWCVASSGLIRNPAPAAICRRGVFFCYTDLLRNDGTLRALDLPLGAETGHARYQSRSPPFRRGHRLAQRDRIPKLPRRGEWQRPKLHDGIRRRGARRFGPVLSILASD